MHKFYVIDAPSPFIAGFDLVVAAHHIIDAVGRTVCTRSPATNTYVSASLDPISPPATDIVVITSSDPGDEPSSPSPPVPATLEPSTPPSALAAHEPSDASPHPAVAPLTPCFDEPSPLPPSVPPGEPISGPDAADSDVPEHLRVLFLIHFRRPTCHLRWPQVLRISSWRTKMLSPPRRLTSDFAIYLSTTSTQPMRLPYGNHLVDPLWPQERQRTTSSLKC